MNDISLKVRNSNYKESQDLEYGNACFPSLLSLMVIIWQIQLDKSSH